MKKVLIMIASLVLIYSCNNNTIEIKNDNIQDKSNKYLTNMVDCYTYISPEATVILSNNKINELEILDYTSNYIKQFNIRTIESSIVYDDAEDSLRVDIRKVSNNLIIELSIRQGASVNNMIERWRNIKEYEINNASNIRDIIFNSIKNQMYDLNEKYSTEEYKKWKSMQPQPR